MNADRNLLFGILALQNDFITRDQLVAAMNDWVLEKQTPLGEILQRRGALASDVFGLLDALVDKQIAKHQGDVQASMAALSSVSDARSALQQITDEQVQATLRTLQPPADCGMPGTVPFFGTSANKAGRFTILRPHAAGGLGEVFVAKDNELDREVALKQIKEQYSQSSQSQSRFKLEAEVTGGLEHPGIVPVYSLGQYGDGRPYYAMRFIRGDSLKDAIDQFHGRSGHKPDYASLEFRGLLRRFIDVCNAIAYAHSRGILHRDLKPGNIMLGKYGETLVVDWGLAKTMGAPAMRDDVDQSPLVPPSSSGSGYEATAPGSAIGTPAYMSPEQAEGKLDQLGPATDVYSLGTTLYTILAGQPAFKGQGIIEVLENVRLGKFAHPRSLQPTLPPALQSICLKAMSLRPADRYASSLDLANDLEHWLADEPVTAHWDRPVVRFRRFLRKRAALATGIAVAVVVGLVSLATGFIVVSSAYASEHAAKELAKSNEATAKANEQKAETEFRRAKTAIDEYFVAVSQSNELKVQYPGMHDFRIKLLNKAEQYYREFLRERGDDPKLQAYAAHAFFNSALVAAAMGRNADARVSYEAAMAIREKLVHDDPSGCHHARDLADTYNNWGNLLSATGDRKAGMIGHAKALAIFERLVRDYPAVSDYAKALAASHNNLAVLQNETGDTKAALASYVKALAIQERLARDNPTVSQYAIDLVRTYINLGVLQYGTGDAGAARSSYTKARTLGEKLVREHPAVSQYAGDLARVYNNLGNLQTRTGDEKAALTSYALAIAGREKLARDNPAVTRYAIDLAASHNNLGNLQSHTGDVKAALASFAKAVSIQEQLARDNPAVTRFSSDLAASLNNLGLLQSKAGDVNAALASYTKALAIHEKLAFDNPGVIAHLLGLGGGCLNLGNLVQRTNPQQSLLLFDRAIKSLEGPAKKNSTAREFLRNSHWSKAISQARLGRLDEALVDFDVALKLDDGSKSREINDSRGAVLAKSAAKAKAQGKSSDAKPIGANKQNSSKTADNKSLR